MPTRIVLRMQRSLRGRNTLLNLFELWVGFAGIIDGVVFFYSPASIDHNALSRVIGYSLSATWSTLYFVAGVLLCYGLLRPTPRWEIVGLILLASATSIEGIALLDVFGLTGTATVVTLLSLSVASFLRSLVVWRAVNELTAAERNVTRG